MADFDNSLPRTAIMYSMMLAHLNSAFNSILYAIFNPAYQQGYKRFFLKINESVPYLSIYRASSVKNTNIFTISSKSSKVEPIIKN